MNKRKPNDEFYLGQRFYHTMHQARIFEVVDCNEADLFFAKPSWPNEKPIKKELVRRFIQFGYWEEMDDPL